MYVCNAWNVVVEKNYKNHIIFSSNFFTLINLNCYVALAFTISKTDKMPVANSRFWWCGSEYHEGINMLVLLGFQRTTV
jgi:hypothetical protein